MIGCKSPDIWDGNRKLIELFGDYWHQGDDPQERIAHFEKYGFQCLVIWESELKNGRTVTLIRDFVNESGE